MAEYYVYSGATGAADGSSWADAFTSLATAFSGKAAGDVFYVADDHFESSATSVTLNTPGTQSNPCHVLCVLRNGGTVPPVASDLRSTAAIETTGANTIIIIGPNSTYWYGLQFVSGNGISSNTTTRLCNPSQSSSNIVVFEKCLVKLATTGTNARLLIAERTNNNQRGQVVEFIDTQLEFSNTNQSTTIGSQFLWHKTTTPVVGVIPNTLISTPTAQKPGTFVFSGLDFSSHGSGKSLLNISGQLDYDILFKNCKFNAAGNVTTGTHGGFGGVHLRVINSDSSDTNYAYQKTDGAGDVTHETTIVRTGGASDGTTAISRKMVSSSRTQYYAPLYFDIMFWNETTGSQLSLAAEVVSDNVTFTDKELWMEVEALTTSGFPISSFTNDAAATILTTGVNQATSTATWTTTGLTTPVKQKLEVNVTPQEKGWVRCRINLAKPSSTVYVCPLITGIGYTSGRQWQTSDAYLIEGSGTGSGVRIPNIRGGADQ